MGSVGKISSIFNINTFTEHAEEYVGGGVDIDNVFTKQELNYIKNNMKETNQTLYRVEESRFTADKIDTDKFDVDNFKFSGTFRSTSNDFNFIKSTLDEDSDNYANMSNPVIFEITGSKKVFNMEPYTGNYNKMFGSQGEHFIGGNFKQVGEDYKKINGKLIRIIKIKQL